MGQKVREEWGGECRVRGGGGSIGGRKQKGEK